LNKVEEKDECEHSRETDTCKGFSCKSIVQNM
jgi:hypothetical protein